MTTGAVPVVRAGGEGETRWFYGGGTHVWKLSASETGGALMLFEDVLGEGKVTPWHQHPDADEVVYLLEGEIEIVIGESTRRVGAGGVTFVPRGTPHAFRVISAGGARLLALQTPGHGDRFFREASEPATPETSEGSGKVDFARIRAAAASTGSTVVLGPPPFRNAER